MVVVATQVTAVVAAVVLTVVRRVSLMVIALRVLTVTLRLALMRTRAPKRIHAPKLRPALTSHLALAQVVRSNRRVHPTVATTAVTTMIAHHAPVVTPVTAATLAVVKTVVHHLLIVVVRIHALVLHALMQPHVRTKAAKSVVHSAVIVRTLVLLLVTVTAMIAQRALSVTVIHVRSLIVRRALTRIVVIVSNALSADRHHAASTPRPRAANTPRVHVPSARSHSSVLSVRNTRHVPRVRSSTKLALRATRSVQQVLPQPHLPTVAIVRHVALPSRLNTLRR